MCSARFQWDNCHGLAFSLRGGDPGQTEARDAPTKRPDARSAAAGRGRTRRGQAPPVSELSKDACLGTFFLELTDSGSIELTHFTWGFLILQIGGSSDLARYVVDFSLPSSWMLSLPVLP